VPTARDVGQSSSCIQQWACGLPYPAAGRRSSPPVAFPACVSTHVPRRWIPGHCLPFCTPIRPRCRLTVQRRPTGAGCIPQPAIRGRSAIALPWSRSPCSHFPRPFCDVSGAPLLAMSIDRWGLRIGQEQRRGPVGDRPPPLAPSPVIQLRSRW